MNKSEIEAIAREVNLVVHQTEIAYWKQGMEAILSLKKLNIKDVPKYTKRVIALAKEYPGDNPPPVSQKIMDQVVLTNMDRSSGMTRIESIVKHASQQLLNRERYNEQENN